MDGPSLPLMTTMHKGALVSAVSGFEDRRACVFWVWIGTRLSTWALAVRRARGHMGGRSGASLADQDVKNRSRKPTGGARLDRTIVAGGPVAMLLLAPAGSVSAKLRAEILSQ
jgi:hypothetical protein